MKIKFPDDNDIVFGQDHAWWVGVPSNLTFEVDEIWKDGKVWLSAPGYGGEPYGNGKILVYLKTHQQLKTPE